CILIWASFKAVFKTVDTHSTCIRLAISGTTPPNIRCVSICDATTLHKSSRLSFKIATAISSQLDSIAKIRLMLFPPFLLSLNKHLHDYPDNNLDVWIEYQIHF